MADTLDDIEAEIRTTIRDLRENPQRIGEYVTAVERERRAKNMAQNNGDSKRDKVHDFIRANMSGELSSRTYEASPPEGRPYVEWTKSSGAAGTPYAPYVKWQEIPFVVPPDQTISTGPRITQVMDEYEPTKEERARAYLRFAAGEAWEAVKLIALCVSDVVRAVRVLTGRR